MPLGDAQIERYSRQIVAPGFGGKAQERLLAAELVVIGGYDDLAMPLRYLAGAGVGRIHVDSRSVGARAGELIAQAGALNPDVTIDDATTGGDQLVLALVGANASCDALAALVSVRAFVVARLDAPATVAIIARRPPCPACSDAGLLKPIGRRVAESNFIAMLAAAEALKIIAGLGGPQAARVIEFHGYESQSRVLGISQLRHCAAGAKPRSSRGRGK
jgi:hypothetical protein